MSLLSDLTIGTKEALISLGPHILQNYVKVPIGILTALAILYGVNEIIILTTINFPSSVTCMLILYLALVISAKIWGEKKISWVLDLINIPAGFSLRWINIFFTPAFITLPLSDWISAKEALTIAAVFVFGYFICTAVIAYFAIALQKLLGLTRKSNVERAEELEGLVNYNLNEGSTSAVGEDQKNTRSNSIVSLDRDRDSIELERLTSTSHHTNRLDNQQLERMKSYQSNPPMAIEDLPRGDEDIIEEEYRREHEYDSIKITLSTHKSHQTIQIPSPTKLSEKQQSLPQVDVKVKGLNKLFCKRTSIDQQTRQVEIERHVKIKEFIVRRFDYIVFFVLFIVSLPLYFIKHINYEMPLQLAIAIFTFLFLLHLPVNPKYKKYFHPVLCSVGISWLLFYIFALMKHESFLDTIRNYKTGRNYLKLFNHKANNERPGAGDIFSSLMDVSIVSLSIPMFTYRRDLKRHFFVLLPTILLMTFSNFFIYPPMCYAMGISPERSLGFAGRSVTLALGTPFVQALDGSIPLMACTTVVSGIIGALTCEFVFGKILKIREDDYITRGSTLGLNCGAIATAHLLTVDPRAAAMSSLSFVLFGTFMVVLGSIVPLANVLRSWVGLA